ncbi:MAG TPA: cupin domain-containing protein, partial [Methylophilaceae bacterium]|nr:cupin domain-containing protein [Methylophilaceae bacterium]
MKKSQDAKSRLDLLGGLTAEQFLQEYWQKKPLLIRNAIPDFSGLLRPEELAGLACEEGVQSRLVSQQRNKWRVEEGPFEEERFLKLPARNWTLLVQEVNHHLDEADALLRRFNFIPYARLDDLMVSYAPDEGGVGPHFDSYDVFLLQGQGKRLWRISEQKDLSLIADAPLRILKHFETEQEWLLGPGDMLYLPPHIAHWGIAKGDCMTYS